MRPETPSGHEGAPKFEHSPLKVALYEAAGDLPSQTEICSAEEVAGRVAALAHQYSELSQVAITFSKIEGGEYEIAVVRSRE